MISSKLLAIVVAVVALNGCTCNSPPGGLPDAEAGPRVPQKLEFLIDWQAEPTYVGVYYAQAAGYFAQAGFDASIVESWGANQAATAVAAGKYNIGTASGGATVLGIDKGKELVSMAVLYKKIPTVIYGLATNGIQKPQDLYGKKLGMYAGSITVNEYQAFAAAQKLDRSKITEVLISGSDVASLKAHSVDAVLNYRELSPVLLSQDPEAPEVSGHRINALSLADYGVGGYGLNIIAQRSWVATHLADAKAITAAVVRGYREGCTNQVAAVDAFCKKYPEKNKAYVTEGWKLTCEHIGDLANLGSQDADGWRRTSEVYKSLGLLTESVDPARILP